MTLRVFERIAECTTKGGSEYYISLALPDVACFGDAARVLQSAYRAVCSNVGCSSETEISVRFFCSDIANQALALRHIWRDSSCAFLCPVGQPPLDGRYMTVQAYHIKARNAVRKTRCDNGLLYKHGGYTSLLSLVKPEKAQDSQEQTDVVITSWLRTLARHGAELERDVLRTWYYIRDIDNNYAGMVQSRLAQYALAGLDNAGHSIASTGIEGAAAESHVLSWLVGWMSLGLAPQQTTFLDALDYLPHTRKYGVNFERATRFVYGDRSHILISGTASIDAEGNVMHCGDIARQTERIFANIEALLSNGRMGLSDLKKVIVYLRDGDDYPRVAAILREILGVSAVCSIVRASVCRPGWLVEIEGIAATGKGQKQFFSYC